MIYHIELLSTPHLHFIAHPLPPSLFQATRERAGQDQRHPRHAQVPSKKKKRKKSDRHENSPTASKPQYAIVSLWQRHLLNFFKFIYPDALRSIALHWLIYPLIAKPILNSLNPDKSHCTSTMYLAALFVSPALIPQPLNSTLHMYLITPCLTWLAWLAPAKSPAIAQTFEPRSVLPSCNRTDIEPKQNAPGLAESWLWTMWSCGTIHYGKYLHGLLVRVT